ncbi:MAG: hypothetical protein EOP50_18580, partial [Sphingobacteriales bacterium]
MAELRNSVNMLSPDETKSISWHSNYCKGTMTLNHVISLLLSVTVAALVAGEATVSVDMQQFKIWQQQFGKRYSSVETELQAFATWLENKQFVEQINRVKGSTWSGGLNQFSDLTASDFRRRHLLRLSSSGYPQHNATVHASFRQVGSKADPASFDWRTDGSVAVVTRVRDQGSVGSCWAFSAAQNIEGQWALAGHALTELSPEFLVDCDGSSDGSHADCSVFGGWPYLSFQFVAQAGGIPSEQAWPYCAGTGDCYPCMQGPVKLCGPPPLYCDPSTASQCSSFSAAAAISTWTAVSTQEDDIRATLLV